MGIFRKKHDITDIYGVRNKKMEGFRLPDAPSKRNFNRHYHNFFRGYTEIRRTDEKGRIKIERYYTKPWIVSGLSVPRYWLLRLGYLLLTAFTITLYIVALSRKIPGNLSWVVALPGMPAAVVLFLQAAAVIQYLTVPKKMTLWDHESSTKHIKRATLVSSVILVATAAALLLFLVFDQREPGTTLLCCLALLVASAGAFAIHQIEKKVPYTNAPNETKLPPGEAHEIR